MFTLQAASAGLLAGFVGFASSFAIVVQGLVAVGASPAEATSGLMALSIAMGLCGIVLSLKTRLPISVAWSTPGAALLAGLGAMEGGFAAAVGAFIVTAVLIIIAGQWKPLGRLVAAIPAPLANAMLAGVLLGLCLAPVRAVMEFPTAGLLMVVAWAVTARINKLLAVPVAVVVTGLAIWFTVDVPPLEEAAWWPTPVFIAPSWSLEAIIGISLPLFIVTMASQNIPGIAVLKVNNYHPVPGPLFTMTGLFSLSSAIFGGHGVNLAAITAALCAGESAHRDPAQRYWAAVVAGIVYVLFGLAAGAATAFIKISPPILIQGVAGLALFGAFGSSLFAAMSRPEDREPAIITLLVTASGLTLFGVGGAFWGLVAGGVVYGLARLNRKKAPEGAL